MPKKVRKVTEDLNLQNIVAAQFDEAAALIQQPRALLEQIKRCDNVFQVNFPVKLGRKLHYFFGLAG